MLLAFPTTNTGSHFGPAKNIYPSFAAKKLHYGPGVVAFPEEAAFCAKRTPKLSDWLDYLWRKISMRLGSNLDKMPYLRVDNRAGQCWGLGHLILHAAR